MRAMAVPEARASRCPLPPQLQTGPSGSTTMWPISATDTLDPLRNCPLMIIPPPIPVLTVIYIRRSNPRPAPNRCSPRAARSASFSTQMGMWNSSSSCSFKGTSRQVGRLGGVSITPVRGLIGPAAPTAIPTTSLKETLDAVFLIAVFSRWMPLSGPSCGRVGSALLQISLPSRSARATRKLVPPMSTAMTKFMSEASGIE
ncbi:MAG: hypothetical protein DDT27_01664 [Dehalococcoidia bacterium]|nr:hypothetical protein [Chloroflexota bacterium]